MVTIFAKIKASVCVASVVKTVTQTHIICSSKLVRFNMFGTQEILELCLRKLFIGFLFEASLKRRKNSFVCSELAHLF